MLNIDPLLFQPKVIRMSTTSSIGLPGQHIIRTTEYSNSQVMTGTAAHIHNEANNNILNSNTTDTAGEFASRGRDFGNVSGGRDLRNFNEMELSTDQESADRELDSQQWSAEMYWSGEGDFSDNSTLERLGQQNSASIMSFQSNLSNSTASASFHSQLSDLASESKEEIVSSMLNKVRSHNKVEASKILLAMSNSVDNCLAMRQCGVLPLLIQLLHSPDENSNTYHMVHAKRVNFEIRERASQVLHNIVFSQPDDKKGRREARVLRLLEQIRDYCDQLRNLDTADLDDNRNSRCVDQHLGPAVAALMKLSFDEDHRYAMCQLGGLQAIAELLQIDHEVHGCTSDQYCITIRRYSGMALTNLTFGDGANKALLCSMRSFMEALVAQLYSPSEDLRQVTASVLRNLSWRADPASKRILRDVGAVTILVKAAMEAEKESTLKSILSALWNLSAHCSANKADICLVDGALAFLVSTLTYKSKSKTLAIVENGGGILRNVSSHIAIQNDYRVILRKHNCLQTLLQHLKSPSLTVVSNACGTLWNLSARNAVDQRALWEMGAVGMLKKLINSKHKMISMGSSAALKNLLSAKPPGVALGLCVHNDGYKGSAEVPSLHIRKEKALSTEIDQNLAETYDNTDSPKTSPSHHATNNDKGNRVRRHISPSAARYMTAQKQRNDLLSLQNRGGINDEKLTYVVEEKHNGAFQVTKNAKQAMNYQQGQKRLSMEFKDSTEESSSIPQYKSDNSLVDKDYEALKFRSARPSVVDGQIAPPKPPHTAQFRSQSPPKYAAERSSPQLGVRKDYKAAERVTNVAQKSRNICRDAREQIQERSPKHVVETSGIPKPVPHESRIPLPKSCSKLDAQRSQSASPVPQRRGIPQRQDNNLQSTSSGSSRNVDLNATHPKYAWTNNCEKEDNEPEHPVGRLRAKYQESPQPRAEASYRKSYPPALAPSTVDDYSYGNEDEVKVYQTENTPLNYSLNSSMTDLEEVGAAARCSLNIKTCTNVKLMKNHPLLSNVANNRVDEDGSRLFEFRHGSSDYRNFEGKTVDFSVQSDYDIDENLSMMSRSSSVASISSFDQQSFHDDESFASDLSHHTSGIESPGELSDSPCQTVPSSPQKAVKTSNSSDVQQMKLSAVETATVEEAEAAEGEFSTLDSADGSCYQNAETGSRRDEMVQQKTAQHPLKHSTSAPLYDLQATHKTESLPTAKPTSDSCDSSPKSAEKLGRREHSPDNDPLKLQYEQEQSTSEPTTVSADFVTCASELGSCSSLLEGENMEDISPIERAMLENCIRAGMPQKSSGLEQGGARQKIPQLSYQLLRDPSSEKHPKACSFESDRSTSLKSLELKENEYESHSENEEKGKEDERKAEKKRLFRIPESPVDLKKQSPDSNRGGDDYSPSRAEPLNTMKVLVDQKGNRRSEKHDRRADKIKSKQQSSSDPVSSQLDFLMTNKKANSSGKHSSAVAEVPKKTQCQTKVDHDEMKHRDDLMDIQPVSDQMDLEEEAEDRESTNEAFVAVQPTRDELVDEENENLEKDVDCSEKEHNGDPEEIMLTSSLLCEAREIAEALLGARVGSTEDMTVSTLSCLSDIDSARPPSVMGDMGSLSMTNSSISEENLKAAVTKECQKLLGKAYNKQVTSSKKSLLRELQIVRLNSEHGANDFSKGSNESPENTSMKSSSASDLLGNINPPSILDEMSLTASTGSLNGIEASDSECDSEKVVAPYPSKKDSSMSERMHDAAAMAQLYAKELSNITGGNCVKKSASNDALSRVRTQQSGLQEVMEVTIADVTEIGCDTIGSDTELDDDFPCDEDDPDGSETLQAPFVQRHSFLSKEEQQHGDGSTENLTLTLTEEPPRADLSPYFDFGKNNNCFMTAEEFKALQENADMILNTLREAEISDDEDDDEEHCALSTGDMLDDETMSLVSNESDEEFLSPDGSVHLQKHSPKNDCTKTSQVCNGMVALPQNSFGAPSKNNSSRKTSLPQMSAKKPVVGSGFPKPDDQTAQRNRYSYPSSHSHFSESPKKSLIPPKATENSLSRIKAPLFNRNSAEMIAEHCRTPEEEYSGGFDSRTFTRKKSTVPRGMIPSIQSGPVPPSAGFLRSPSSHNVPSLPGSTDNIAAHKSSEPAKVVTSKIAAVWKNGKVRSKSMVDANRNSKFRLEKSASTGSTKDEKFGAYQSERSPSQTPSPQSPLSRSSTYEKLNDDSGGSPSKRRPSTLPLSQKTTGSSPRHVRMPTAAQQRPATHRQVAPRATTTTTIPKTDIVSPTSQYQSNIPKFQNKAQPPSLIPNRRSMIPTPAKFELPD